MTEAIKDFFQHMERAPGSYETTGWDAEARLVGSTACVSARVLNRLRGGGWARGLRQDGERLCVLGAYAQELYGSPGSRIYLDRLSVLRQVILEQYPGKYAENDWLVVPKFNDDPDITWDDIERVLEKAAAIEQEGIGG